MYEINFRLTLERTFLFDVKYFFFQLVNFSAVLSTFAKVVLSTFVEVVLSTFAEVVDACWYV